MSNVITKSVEEWVRGVDYSNDVNYVPSKFALEFINFIKMVNGGEGEENKSPVLHYKILDQLIGKNRYVANMIHRGAAKTTIMEYFLPSRLVNVHSISVNLVLGKYLCKKSLVSQRDSRFLRIFFTPLSILSDT